MSSKQPLEIERKFLIEYPDLRALAALPGCRLAQLTQTYLLSTEGEELRVRRREENGQTLFIKTSKRAVSASTRIELESEISEQEYEALLKAADPHRRPIVKTRCCVPWDALLWEIDVYPFWQDRAIAEVELSSAEQSIVIPPFLCIIAEITGDPAYKNAALAQRYA